jgi:hypothetical protein
VGFSPCECLCSLEPLQYVRLRKSPKDKNDRVPIHDARLRHEWETTSLNPKTKRPGIYSRASRTQSNYLLEGGPVGCAGIGIGVVG